MQKDLPKRVKRVSLKLKRTYGKKKLRVHNDPLSELIATILSQNTSDHNSHRAYSNLISRFRTWDRVRKASWQRVADAIRSGGLADIKAQRIKNVLNQIYKENRRLDLDFLKKWETDKIKTYLRRFKGVGEKTVACVLLFSLKRPVMPVDTHVLRVSRRLGLVPPRADTKKAQAFLEKLVPGKQIYQFHMSLIQHGREICKASNPRCHSCVLPESCDYGGRALGL
ncbi:MAG: endonuclease III [candidate division Zixibacteria bacterium]|nr:endonuclease III [candidate division Zixibacteria bacterium]